MKRPDDLVPDLLWFTNTDDKGNWFSEAFSNPERHEEPCRVFWGSHGCARPRGHDGDHWCDCCDCDSHPGPGCVAGPPYYGEETEFFGEDAA